MATSAPQIVTGEPLNVGAKTDVTISQVSQTLTDDEKLAQQALSLLQKKDWVSLAMFAMKNKGTIEKQVDAVASIAPLAKEGYKTSEFWLVAAYVVINLVLAAKGQPLPFADDTTIGSVVAAYVAGRHYIKGQVVNSASPSVDTSSQVTVKTN